MTIRMTGGSVPGGAFCALIDTPHVASFGHNDATRTASFGSDFGHQLLGACLSIPRGITQDGFAFNRGGADAVGSRPNKEATTMSEGKSVRSRRAGRRRG